ncbi:hypothetical protein UPYG_G00055530 [Umbra pygmaea]|uniref:Uncharacterized protein n=1 Tax=Umbra pygmaea TaxID=75934 RepID=A0ABD0X8U5_UMBPY
MEGLRIVAELGHRRTSNINGQPVRDVAVERHNCQKKPEDCVPGTCHITKTTRGHFHDNTVTSQDNTIGTAPIPTLQFQNGKPMGQPGRRQVYNQGCRQQMRK